MAQLNPPAGSVRFSHFVLDLRTRELRKNGIRVRLQEHPFRILLALLERPGELVSRPELQRRIWPDETFVDFEKGLNNGVKRLRDVLCDSSDAPKYIETLTGQGYRFIAQIHPEPEAESTPRLTSPADSVLSEKKGARGLRILAAISLGCATVAAVLMVNWSSLGDRLLLRPSAPTIRSIAVLPLRNISDDPAQEYFADGMTEELITDLAQISALRVTSRTTVTSYKNTNKPAPRIADELHVDGIVTGTVRRSGNRIRVSAQLVYGPRDQQLWAQSYDGDLRDAFTVQNSIARSIAEEIRVKTTPLEAMGLKNVRPVNPQALEAYLSGRSHLDQYQRMLYYSGKQKAASDELSKALAGFNQAIALDPQYAPPYLWFFDGLEAVHLPLDLVPSAKAGVEKALAFDERNVLAHLARARLLEEFDYDWDGAQREIRRAIDLNPNSADAHYQYAQHFLCLGREVDEKRELDIAQALDPGRDYFYTFHFLRMGWTADQQKQAVEERAPEVPILRFSLGKTFATAGRFDEAAQEYEKGLRLFGYAGDAGLLHDRRTRTDGKTALRDWMRRAEKQHVLGDRWPAGLFAFTYASLGDKENAFRWLNVAYQERDWCIMYLNDDLVWAPVRSDPRFTDLLRRVGLLADQTHAASNQP